MALRWIGFLGVVMRAGGATGEVYFSDSTIELSGSGARASRSCMLVLLPARTLGETAAPRLILLSEGLSRLSFGIANAIQYESVELVRNNTRMPLIGSTGVTAQQFLASDMGKAIKSRRLFFVTARRVDTGKLVSSRYEPLDFDAILRRLETHCPFDAEALMADVSDRERAERALGLSQSDIRLIRWAISKRLTNSSREPDTRAALSPSERSYLKRYAAENGLPATQYLTAELVQRLKSEGAELARLAPPPAQPSPPAHPTALPPSRPAVPYGVFTFRLCNHSDVPIAVALSHHKGVNDERFSVEGWWIIEKGQCQTRRYPKGWFYFYGEQRNSGGARFWGKNDLMLCVEYPGPFERVNTPDYSCDKPRLKGFHAINIGPRQNEYTFNMNN